MDEAVVKELPAGNHPSGALPSLDDGYGSSNSSPHSTGFIPYGSPGQQQQQSQGLKQQQQQQHLLLLQQQQQQIQQQLQKQQLLEKGQKLEKRRSVGPGESPENGDIQDEKKCLEVRLVGGEVTCKVLEGGDENDSDAGDAGSVAGKTTVAGRGPKGPDGRETWTNNADFLLSIIGFAVDLANVWRFPYLCYRNGGGAFLIPYTLMLLFGALPLFYMELILGQYNRQGPITVWKICPIFKGVGMCAVIVAFFVSFYYNVIIAWSLYFLIASFSAELPWLHCNNTWNTDDCRESALEDLNLVQNLTFAGSGLANITLENALNNVSLREMFDSKVPHSSAASEYFSRGVLEMQWSDGLHDIGFPKWQLVLCVLAVYCMLYLSLFKGVKSSGKVVWATATLPYVVLAILLIRGLMLPGALSGIKYYLQPELSKLKETQVWLDAAVQIFYSVGAGFGVHLSYASYNNFNNNCFNDCIITTAVNCFTSFFSGFVIFTYLGFMSHKQGIPISSVATEGPGLVFQVYPEAVATLPGSHFWSILFFFMLIMLGLDSGMGGLECVITGLMDEFGTFFRGKRYAREIFTLCVVGLSFTVAIVNVTPGGIYMFHLFDTYSAGVSLLCSALFEAIAVSWFYGIERICDDAEAMTGRRPGIYWRVCWKFISPLFIIGVVMFGLLYQEPLTYQEYKYPSWAEWIGWSLALTSVLSIPVLAIIQIISSPGSFRDKIAYSISPVEEHDAIARTNEVPRFKCRHWLYI